MRNKIKLLAAICGLAAVTGSGAIAAAAAPSARNAGPLSVSRTLANPMAAASARVHALMAPPKWVKPGPALQVGNRFRGKKAYFIGNLAYEYDQTILSGVRDAAKALGMTVIGLDANAQAGKFGTLIDQAIGGKAAVIFNQGYPEEKIAQPLLAAKKAGIPVIGTGLGKAQFPPPAVRRLGVPGWSVVDYQAMGQAMADWTFVDSKGHANVLVLEATDLSVTPAFVSGFQTQMAKLCPTCKRILVDTPLANWNTQLSGAATTALQKDSSINYVFALYDPMVPLILPGIEGMGAGGRVKIITADASTAEMKMLKPGGTLAVDMGSPTNWVGWGLMDQALRAMLGKPCLKTERIPNRLFVSSNVRQIDLSKSSNTWYGSTNWGAQYLKLWGVK